MLSTRIFLIYERSVESSAYRRNVNWKIQFTKCLLFCQSNYFSLVLSHRHSKHNCLLACLLLWDYQLWRHKSLITSQSAVALDVLICVAKGKAEVLTVGSPWRLALVTELLGVISREVAVTPQVQLQRKYKSIVFFL